MRDYIETNNIVVVIENIGSVGHEKFDEVNASPFEVGYFAARTVLMELMSVWSTPIASSLAIFNPKYYDEYIQGVKKAFYEVKIDIPLISTTETNFAMKQSAISITLIGNNSNLKDIDKTKLSYGVIGNPVVGSQVLKSNIVSLAEFCKIANDNNIKYILPVGSQGIRQEFENNLGIKIKTCSLDLDTSAGPSTAIIIGYTNEEEIISSYDQFTKIEVINDFC
ncbi:MAG: hypothetical protein ACK5NF_01100 [Bacilli bacterium]